MTPSEYPKLPMSRLEPFVQAEIEAMRTKAHQDAQGRHRNATHVLPTIATTIRRTMDATFLNEVANHVEVRPWLGGDGPIDFAPVLVNPANLAAVAAHGGFVAIAQGYGRYEIHSLFLPERPGGETMAAMADGLRYLFSATDATELVTKVPDGNRAAMALAKRGGFVSHFSMAVAWTGGTMVPADFLMLGIERWALRSEECLRIGRWFHTAIESATVETHSPEDDVHLRIVGAAVLMLQAGHVKKAVPFYNQWARLTGYSPVVVLREQPIVIAMDDVIVEAREGAMEVLSCP